MTEEAESPDGTSDSESLAADGSKEPWGRTTTIKEDLEAGMKMLDGPIRPDPPLVVGPLLFEILEKENMRVTTITKGISCGPTCAQMIVPTYKT
jgi:hypothetical protein